MSKLKSSHDIKLSYDNWHIWDCYIKSTIRCKNAYLAFDPEPVDPRTLPQVISPMTLSASLSIPSITVTCQPSAKELEMYHSELKAWKATNNITAGIILGTISDEVQYVIDLEDYAKIMYDKLRAEVVKQSSGSSTNGMQIELVYKQFKDKPTMENLEKHLTFYHLKNATLNTVGAGFNNSFLA
jgi:hypothetical protein